jgi:hypothetical protein
MWKQAIAVGIIVNVAWWAADAIMPSVPWYVRYLLVFAVSLGPLMVVDLVLSRRKLSMVFRPADAPPPLTGPPLAKARWVTAFIDSKLIVNFLSVTAYADRLVVGMATVGDRTIMVDQLGRIDSTGSRRSKVWIEHSAPGLVSPLTLMLRRKHPVRRAIESLVRQ